MAYATVVKTEEVATNNTTTPQFADDGTDITIVEPAPREGLTAVFNIDFTGTTDDVEVRVYGGIEVTSGTADGGAASTIDLNTAGGTPLATSTFADDELIGHLIVLTGGPGEGDIRMITDWDGTTNDRATVATAFSATPTSSTTYRIFDLGVIQAFTIIADEDPSQGDLNSVSTFILGYPEVLFAAFQPGGTTDTHQFRVTYRLDGISA